MQVTLPRLCCGNVTMATASAAAVPNFNLDVVAQLLASPFSRLSFNLSNDHHLVSGTVFCCSLLAVSYSISWIIMTEK